MQKLFKNSGTTFSEYLKGRRIQHCCLDLANPALAQFSIAQLCYRWGFNDAANFSRTFSQYVGMPPKAYRAAPPSDLQAQLQRGRPQVAPAVRSSVSPRRSSVRTTCRNTDAPSSRCWMSTHATPSRCALRPSAIRYPPTRHAIPAPASITCLPPTRPCIGATSAATSSQR
ncbi:helix-turn-helix transcriptional regulator [Halopseudomonas pachastrellae]|nr:helix-turn-helix transcriptional regulator [Halopseudomonas pachastrellae]